MHVIFFVQISGVFRKLSTWTNFLFRVLGLDAYDTAHFYSVLANLSHKVGKTDLAVKYTKRALYLNRMSSGAGNTEEISLSVRYLARVFLPHFFFHLPHFRPSFDAPFFPAFFFPT